VREKVIDEAREVGVKHFLVPAVDIESSLSAIKIANDYENVYATVGIHPTSVFTESDLSKSMQHLEDLVEENEKIVAIGEVGLDYYRNVNPARVQKIYLSEQIKLASKLGLSLVLHSRHSTKDLLSLLEEKWNKALFGRTVLHAAEAREDVLAFIEKNDIYVGIDGDITYDTKKQEFIKKVPITKLVLETDSPFLTPEPARSVKRFPNEPKNILLVAESVAKLKKLEISTVKNQTTINAKRLFAL